VPEYKSNGVIVWHSGVVAGADLIAANMEVFSHKYDDGLLFQLLDFSNADELRVLPGEIRTLAEMDRGRVKDTGQFACVVAPTSTLFGFSRQWSIQAEEDGFQTHVARSMDEAIAWFESKGISVTFDK